jgi:hypothetical protein
MPIAWHLARDVASSRVLLQNQYAWPPRSARVQAVSGA